MNTNNNDTAHPSAHSANPQRSRRIRNRNFKRVASVACVISTSGWSQSPSCVSAFQSQSLTFSTIKTATNDRFKVRNLRPTLTELCYRDDPDFKTTTSDASSAAVNNHLTEETKEQLGQAAPPSTSEPSSAASVEESAALASPPPSSNINQLSNVFHTWWTAPQTRRAHQIAREQRRERSDQVDLDAYLESIDKRYKRLHGREHRSSRAQKQQRQQQSRSGGVGGNYSNALSWLLATEDSSSEAAEQQRQENGIYVLGLAGLASDRLLQKHHLLKPKNNNKGGTARQQLEKSRVIDISSQQVVVPSTTTRTTTTVTSPSLSLLYSMKHIQTAMNAVSLHTRNYFLESLRSTGKMMTTIPSAINTAIGGKWAKQAVMTLLTAMFALVVATFRPFSKA